MAEGSSLSSRFPSSLLVYVDKALPGYDDMVAEVKAVGGIQVTSPSQAFMVLQNPKTLHQAESNQFCARRIFQTVAQQHHNTQPSPTPPPPSGQEREFDVRRRRELSITPTPAIPRSVAQSESSEDAIHGLPTPGSQTPIDQQPAAGPSRPAVAGRSTWATRPPSIVPSSPLAESEVDELDPTQQQTTPKPNRLKADAHAFMRHASTLSQRAAYRDTRPQPRLAVDDGYAPLSKLSERAKDYLRRRWSAGSENDPVPLRDMDEAAIYCWAKHTQLVTTYMASAKYSLEELLQMAVRVGLNLEPFKTEGGGVEGLPWYPRDRETKAEWMARLAQRPCHGDNPHGQAEPDRGERKRDRPLAKRRRVRQVA